MKTPEQIAKIFGCTVEQARAQMAANAKQLRALESRAITTSRKVRGYTSSQLTALADGMEAAAA